MKRTSRSKLVVIDCRDLDTLGQELIGEQKATLRPYALIFPVELDKANKIKVNPEKATVIVSRVEKEYFSKIPNIRVYHDPFKDFIPQVAELLGDADTVFLDFSTNAKFDKLPADKFCELRKLLEEKEVSIIPNESIFATRPDKYRKTWYEELITPPMLAKIQRSLSEKQAYFVTDGRRATVVSPHCRMDINPRKEGWVRSLKSFLQANATLLLDCNPYYDMDVLPAGLFLQIEKADINCLPSQELLSKTNTLSASEIESHIAAADKWVQIRDEVLDWLNANFKEGLTEQNVENKIISLLQEDKKYQYQTLTTLKTLVATGPNALSPHHITDNIPLKTGNILLIDYSFRIMPESWKRETGEAVNTVWADGTFLVYLGNPPQKVKEDFAVMRKANLAGVNLAKTRGSRLTFGELASEVGNVLRKYLKNDYSKFIKHHVGHAIGVGDYGVHGKGLPIREGINTPIPPGYCFSIEQGIYRFGTRIETNMIMTKDGAIQTIPLQKNLYTISA